MEGEALFWHFLYFLCGIMHAQFFALTNVKLTIFVLKPISPSSLFSGNVWKNNFIIFSH